MRLLSLITAIFFLFSSTSMYSEEKPFDRYYQIAKGHCHDISAIRVAMDEIDMEILDLMTKRSAYVKRAGDIKSKTTKIADDRDRVRSKTLNIIDRSFEIGMPVEVSLPTFVELIEHSIIFQQAHIDSILSEE